MKPSDWRSWLEENLRGEYSRPRAVRVLEEAGVPAAGIEEMIRSVAREKGRRVRRAALLQMLGGALAVLLATFLLFLRIANRERTEGFVRVPFIAEVLGIALIGSGIVTWSRGRGFSRMSSPPPAEKPAMKGRWGWILAGAGAALILAAVPFLLFALLGPGWIRGKLAEMARERLGAELTIESAEFSPWSGEATLKGIHFRRDADSSRIRARIDSARMRVQVKPLFTRSVRIECLEAERPVIDWTVIQPRDAERATTFEKLKKAFLSVTKRPDHAPDITVDELVLRDGIVDFTSLKEGREPFRARASGVQYRATTVSLRSFGRLMFGADVNANIDIGGTTAALKKSGASNPSTFSLSRIDLARADRYFDQSDALVLAGGAADFRYSAGEGLKYNVAVDFRGLELGENPSAPAQDFAFVPIPKLREWVRANEGHIDLSFTVDGGVEASEDLRLLLDEAWTGLWTAFLKSATSGVIRDAVEKGKQKILDRLKPREEK